MLMLRLGVLAVVDLGAVFGLAALLQVRRRDYVALVLLCLAAGGVLAATQPIIALSEYSDYRYYLHAVGAIEGVVPPRRLFAWALAGARRFEALLWLNGLIAASLPALSYLAALAAGGSRRAAAAAGLTLMASAPFLVYATDGNPMTPFAWAVVVAALLLQVFLRAPAAPGGRAALALSGAVAVLAFLCREEALVLPLVLAAAIATSDQPSRRRAAITVAAWLGLVCVAHAVLAAFDPRPYLYTLARFQDYSRRLGNHLWLFLATNGLLVAFPVVLWSRGRRPLLRELASPLLLPALVYTLVYLNGAAGQEHQIVVLPLLVPQTVVALAALRRRRPRSAVALASVLALWLGGSSAALAAVALRAPKQSEHAELARGTPPGSRVHFMAYPAFDGDPAAPLQALLDDSTRLVELSPPAGCPPDLFAALAFMHERCVENHGPLERCRQVLARAGADWTEQALALARLLRVNADEVRAGTAAGRKWFRRPAAVLRGTRAPAARAQVGAGGHDYLFVPFWARPDRFADYAASDLPQFRWLEAVRLALDVAPPDLASVPGALVEAHLAADGAGRCQALRARPAGAALFGLLERPAARPLRR
ncbi:MAG TPA: hypothetical protein VGQ83_21945 [Polyangia bacterium]|jgi:hypothetical protein